MRIVLQEIKEGRIDEALSKLEEHIKQAIVRKEQKKRTAKPWFNQECYKARKAALTALHRARHTQTQEDLRNYNKTRSYKQRLEKRKNSYQVEEEKKLIKQAEQKWYKAAIPKQPYFPRDISLETWENHFKNVLQVMETRPDSTDREEATKLTHAFSIEEVREQITSSRNKKACGQTEFSTSI
ncbi:hypothetical protein ANN_17600 [Periplaneta americana]|uniref:Uncharacterized protein n=1 Tax=Periplaneta americana TaxID=6978 RepID=A0ABQ8STD9_PERAM|nr:hypothetical protein ANN_17600 [Periplaneta americana]